MAEREVRVCSAAHGRIRLRLLGSACSDCAGGCAGRCSLFSADAAGEIEMAAPPGLPVTTGQTLRLWLDDASLRRAAWRGYGLAWLGLLVGAGLGYGLGLLWGHHVDVLTLLGLLGGTFAAVRSSKRHLPEPELRPAGPEIPIVPSMSDRP